MNYITPKEASQKWGISERRIQKLCEEGRIDGELNKRFSDEKVEFLLKLQWWNWDEEKIFNNLEKLTSEAGLDQLMK
ncbi:hypothetical protein [Desulfosporosinus lacus]|uniref:Helix-turn-helix domain-containing protein n=1 Tax=Desulfosporosinus lacus DSM 15449 TaxID=1121420 RepID=A0A1M5ZCP1_9FIRM|nr:hypothetical protein [Desulfosporosinus lacus]SHI21733.1 hypothetical protein SAMN02746098_03134 [Desulfosporosinus lacus DSM 15449]